MAYIFNSLASSNLGQTTNKTATYFDGTRLWILDNNGNVFVTTFNGVAFTVYSLALEPGGNLIALWGNGTYVFVGSESTGYLYALQFSGGVISQVGSTYATSIQIRSIVCDGAGYIHVGLGQYVKAFLFNGSVFQLRGTLDMGSGAVTKQIIYDGSYLYPIRDYPVSLLAYTFSDPNYSLVGTPETTYPNITSILHDGSRIWVAEQGNGKIRTVTFNGSVFSYGAELSYSPYTMRSLGFDGQFVYALLNTTAINIYQFINPNIVLKGTIGDVSINNSYQQQIAFGGGYGFYATNNTDRLLKSIQMQLSASFNADVITGPAPLTVTFTSV